MSVLLKSVLASAVPSALSACAVTAPGAGPSVDGAAPDSIAVSVGPCSVFCSVYETTAAAYGKVSFTSTRHTAVVGMRARRAGLQIHRSLEADLAAFRAPGGGTTKIPCAVEIADMPTFTITRASLDNQNALATHRSSCRDGRGRHLDMVLRGMPQRRGHAALRRQLNFSALLRLAILRYSSAAGPN